MVSFLPRRAFQEIRRINEARMVIHGEGLDARRRRSNSCFVLSTALSVFSRACLGIVDWCAPALCTSEFALVERPSSLPLFDKPLSSANSPVATSLLHVRREKALVDCG